MARYRAEQSTHVSTHVSTQASSTRVRIKYALGRRVKKASSTSSMRQYSLNPDFLVDLQLNTGAQ
jgi:hypothetical protein